MNWAEQHLRFPLLSFWNFYLNSDCKKCCPPTNLYLEFSSKKLRIVIQMAQLLTKFNTSKGWLISSFRGQAFKKDKLFSHWPSWTNMFFVMFLSAPSTLQLIWRFNFVMNMVPAKLNETINRTYGQQFKINCAACDFSRPVHTLCSARMFGSAVFRTSYTNVHLYKGLCLLAGQLRTVYFLVNKTSPMSRKWSENAMITGAMS